MLPEKEPDDLPKFGMPDFLMEFSTINVDELIVEVKHEIDLLKEKILQEKPCPILFPGSKSIDLYSTIFEDLILKGFTLGYADILHGEILYCSIKPKDKYILVVDASNSGKEIENILKGFKSLFNVDVIKVYSHLSKIESVKRLIERKVINKDQLITDEIVNDVTQYRKGTLRNKIYSYATTSDETYGTIESNYEFITEIDKEKLVNIIEKSLSEVMSCNKIKLYEDDIMNYMTTKRITKYVHGCDNLKEKCYKWFFPKRNGAEIKGPKSLSFIVTIEERDVGYKIGILINYPFEEFEGMYSSNYKDCNIYKFIGVCLKKPLLKIDKNKEIAMIEKGRACATCIKDNILSPLQETIIESIKKNL